MKLRNILFAGVLCLFLCGPALIGLASWGGGCSSLLVHG